MVPVPERIIVMARKSTDVVPHVTDISHLNKNPDTPSLRNASTGASFRRREAGERWERNGHHREDLRRASRWITHPGSHLRDDLNHTRSTLCAESSGQFVSRPRTQTRAVFFRPQADLAAKTPVIRNNDVDAMEPRRGHHMTILRINQGIVVKARRHDHGVTVSGTSHRTETPVQLGLGEVGSVRNDVASRLVNKSPRSRPGAAPSRDSPPSG